MRYGYEDVTIWPYKELTGPNMVNVLNQLISKPWFNTNFENIHKNTTSFIFW